MTFKAPLQSKCSLRMEEISVFGFKNCNHLLYLISGSGEPPSSLPASTLVVISYYFTTQSSKHVKTFRIQNMSKLFVLRKNHAKSFQGNLVNHTSYLGNWQNNHDLLNNNKTWTFGKNVFSDLYFIFPRLN